MKRTLRRLSAALLLALLLTLTACGTPEAGDDPGALRCTISISCQTLRDDPEACLPAKRELVPEDGILLPETEASFTEGESVYDVLVRVCQANGLHMEAAFTAVYDSAYIQGIGNLYEFDAGSLSGWMYSVNGWFPNYGCSQYILQDGDTVVWAYTCDLGADLGAPIEG